MNAELIPFLYTAMATGAVGNATYDGIKVLLGKAFSSLESSAKAQQKEKFELVMQGILDTNETLKQQLTQLQQGKIINQHNRYGDNIAGDKIINK